MGLSQKTIEEMTAGAQALAKYAGKDDIDGDYMQALIRTGVRAKWLRDMETAGKLRIKKVNRRHTSGDKQPGDCWVYEVYVGHEIFTDDNACLNGAWPSEILTANVALALGAGVGEQT